MQAVLTARRPRVAVALAVAIGTLLVALLVGGQTRAWADQVGPGHNHNIGKNQI